MNKPVSGLPLVTIVTATFNVAHYLQQTIDSVRAQTYPNIEWIVIDGASLDGTLHQLKANEDLINCWVSEPDSGIYDAWNKGVRLAHGDYLCFLGADDCWATADSLERLVGRISNDEDMVSGKAAVVSAAGEVIRVMGEPWSKPRMEKRQVVAHPGMLFAKRLFDQYGYFDTGYTIAGDYEWLLRLSGTTRAAYLDEVTVLMGSGGASERKLLTVLSETRSAQKRHVGSIRIAREISFAVYVFRIFAGKVVRFLLARHR